VGLLRTQKNELLEVVKQYGLRPEEFSIYDNSSGTSLTHKSTGAFFRINFLGDTKYKATRFDLFSTLGDTPNKQTGSSLSWCVTRTRFARWARGVEFAKFDADTPDMWEKLQREQELLDTAQYESLGNSPFTADEQTEISNQLREIKEYVKKTYSLSDEQMASIETRFDDAEEASRRIGRKDWLLLFSGIILTLIVTDLIPPDVAQHILTMVLHGLGHLFGGEAPPQIPPQA